ncbi:MAG: thioredoxin domain-containing protein [Pseudomonadota bacterium]|nr:thioredoxin domain-containing protein [Pseudomonadota bacterium]
MKNFSLLLSTVAVILAAVSLVVSLKGKPAAENNIAEALKADPKMVVDALQAYQVQQQEEQRKAAEEALSAYAEDINSSANSPFVGPEDAGVVVVEFFDFSCHYCKKLAPALEKVMADNKDVKFVFKPLAFVNPQVSHYQAQAALAAHNQGKFQEFYKAVMEAEGRMTKESIDEIAKGLNLDLDKYKADTTSDDTNNKLSEIGDLARKIQVNGVPTVLINGKHIQTMSADDLQEAINNAK